MKAGTVTFHAESNYSKITWLISLRFFLILLVTSLLAISIATNKIYFFTFNRNLIYIINLIALIINFFFMFDLYYLKRKKHILIDDSHFGHLGLIHIDFDIVYIVSIIFLTGGFESPFILLLMYNIVTSTFIVPSNQTYFYSLLTLLLLFATNLDIRIIPAFPFVDTRQLGISMKIVYIGLIYTFAVYISRYVSLKIAEKQNELNSLYEKTYRLSITDRLTGLYDQTYFRSAAADAMSIASVNGNPLAIVMIDLDNFKDFNDRNGHLAGSRALQEIAEIMRGSFRKTDMLGKYGGDEFVILMRDIEKEYIAGVLDRFQAKIREHNFSMDEKRFEGITASLGVSLFPENGNTVSELINLADKALYAVKESGKNRLVFFDDLE